MQSTPAPNAMCSTGRNGGPKLAGALGGDELAELRGPGGLAAEIVAPGSEPPPQAA